MEWWSGGVVEWWSGGVVEWWSGGVVPGTQTILLGAKGHEWFTQRRIAWGQRHESIERTVACCILQMPILRRQERVFLPVFLFLKALSSAIVSPDDRRRSAGLR
jgi:hypothetical protein